METVERKTASGKAASKHHFALSALGGFIWFLSWANGPGISFSSHGRLDRSSGDHWFSPRYLRADFVIESSIQLEQTSVFVLRS
jgi:hypothetical protein